MNRIGELRTHRGMTQQDLAILIGVHVGQVGRWERGTSIPSPRNRRAIAKRLGVTVEDLELEDER